MKRVPLFLICGLLVAGCVPPDSPTASPTAASAEVKEGSSFETAIVIRAPNTQTGVPAEYAWLKANRPGWTFVQQELVEHKGRPYDILTIRKGGQTERVFFDITSFFGKI
jgi:hypothetical protein